MGVESHSWRPGCSAYWVGRRERREGPLQSGPRHWVECSAVCMRRVRSAVVVATGILAPPAVAVVVLPFSLLVHHL